MNALTIYLVAVPILMAAIAWTVAIYTVRRAHAKPPSSTASTLPSQAANHP